MLVKDKVESIYRSKKRDPLNRFTDMQKRACCLISTPLNSFDLRYTVYLSEIRKRGVYIGLSFILAFLCAYTQRVSLMYCITLSLQGALSRGGSAFGEQQQGSEWPFSLSNTTLEYLLSPISGSKSCSLNGGTSTELSPIPGLVSTHSLPPEVSIASRTFLEGVEGGTCTEGDTIRLIFTDVEEAFYTLLSISFFWCVLAFTPVLLYHALCFLQPGLYTWQSNRAWSFLCSRVLLLCALFKVVDMLIIPRLLHFFYSFEIQRDSLCLVAETKVVSYVSLYFFVYLITLLFGVLTVVWISYRQKRIIDLFLSTPPSGKIERLTFDHIDTGTRADHPLPKQRRDWGVGSYKGQRGKVWWGCLLLAALVSPPELLSQLSFHFFLVIFSEISIWFAYISSCRALRKNYYSATT